MTAAGSSTNFHNASATSSFNSDAHIVGGWRGNKYGDLKCLGDQQRASRKKSI